MMWTVRKSGVGLAALLCAVALTACGDKKVTVYEQGKYSGAPVAAPWDSPQYGGKQAQWETTLEARTAGQNDYSRIPAR
jgi:uncharacterized protein with NAD-binding domain and iron-sulfur cluster